MNLTTHAYTQTLNKKKKLYMVKNLYPGLPWN